MRRLPMMSQPRRGRPLLNGQLSLMLSSPTSSPGYVARRMNELMCNWKIHSGLCYDNFSLGIFFNKISRYDFVLAPVFYSHPFLMLTYCCSNEPVAILDYLCFSIKARPDSSNQMSVSRLFIILNCFRS